MSSLAPASDIQGIQISLWKKDPEPFIISISSCILFNIFAALLKISNNGKLWLID